MIVGPQTIKGVFATLGPRFLPWQLEGTPEESWEECHIHARNILGEEGYQQLLRDIERGPDDVARLVQLSKLLKAAGDGYVRFHPAICRAEKLVEMLGLERLVRRDEVFLFEVL